MTESTAEVAKSVVTALGGAPALLVLLLLNVAFVAAGSWYLAKQEDHRAADRQILMDRCLVGKVPS